MSLHFSKNSFVKSFPHAQVSDQYLEYQVEHAKYRVHNPDWDNQTGRMTIRVDHKVGGATDDHVTLGLSFHPTQGYLVAYETAWELGGAAYTIPECVTVPIDLGLDELGQLGGYETMGLSDLAADAMIQAFDGFCMLYNSTSELLVRLSDDGGRLYLTAVMSHVLNRACSAVSVAA